MSDTRYFICDLDDKTRLIGSEDYFILQVLDEVWVDKFFWYSISDVVRGYLKYASKTKIKLNKRGEQALLDLLILIEDRVAKTCEKLEKTFDRKKDPIEGVLNERQRTSKV